TGWSLAFIIGFGPIYWLPGVPEVLVPSLKIAGLALFAGALLLNNAFRFPRHLSAPMFVLVGAAIISSVYHGDTFFTNALVLSIIAALAYTVAANDTALEMDVYIERGVLLFALFAVLVIIDAVRGGVT